MIVNLSPDMETKLREYAKREERDLNEFTESIINAFLDEQIMDRNDNSDITDETALLSETHLVSTAGYEPGSLPLGTLANPFAEAIYAKIKFLRDHEPPHKSPLSEYQLSRLNDSILWDIKVFSNLTVVRVSVAAMNKLEEMNKVDRKVDLYSERWHSQHRFDPGRKVFHYEHFVPVSQIREKCREARNASEVATILMTLVSVVWILKAEDETLTNLGYKSKRPDPIEAYRHAGITIHNATTRPS